MKLLLAIAVTFVVTAAGAAMAQTVGYAEAIDRLAVACGGDIAKFCGKAHLGGGRVQQCLTQNQAKVSGACKSTMAQVGVLLQQRAAARAMVMRVCDADMRRLCAGVQQGDGHLLECFFKARQRTSAQCQSAVTNAGYD